MKKKKTLFGLAIGVLFLTSCTQLQEAFDACPKKVQITLNGQVSEESQIQDLESTKITYTPIENQGYNFSWEKDDQIGLYVMDIYANILSKSDNQNAPFTASTAASWSAFSGSLFSWEGSGYIVAVYPYVNGRHFNFVRGNSKFPTHMATGQQRVNVSVGNGAFENGIMIARAKDVEFANLETLTLNFKQVMAFIKMNITDVPSGETISRVGLETDENLLITAAQVYASNGQVVNDDTRVYTSSLYAEVNNASAGSNTLVNFTLFPVTVPTEKTISFYVETTSATNAIKRYKVKEIAGRAFARNYIYTVDLSLAGASEEATQEEAINLSANGTANCYIVSERGLYYFDATTIGNGNEGLLGLSKETTKFHTNNTTIAPDHAGLIFEDESGVITDIRLVDGKIYFHASGKEGNAVIYVKKDPSNEYIWSWHIWCTDQPQDQTYTISEDKTCKLLDRDLGALSAIVSDSLSLGMHYQWGRKDPFPNKIGHTIATGSRKVYNSYGQPVTYYPDPLLAPLNSDIVLAIEMVEAFIQSSESSSYDWYGGEQTNIESRNHYLWGNPYGHNYNATVPYTANGTSGTPFLPKKSIYDPCPPGYMVPPKETWSHYTKDDATFYKWGISLSLNETETAWYSESAMRSGTSNNLTYNNYGYRWSSSPSSYSTTEPTRVSRNAGNFSISLSQETITTLADAGRANGFSVRCAKIQ